MSKQKTIRFDYDNDFIDFIEKVNDSLKPHGLQFQDDGQVHDGYVVMTLEKLEEP